MGACLSISTSCEKLHVHQKTKSEDRLLFVNDDEVHRDNVFFFHQLSFQYEEHASNFEKFKECVSTLIYLDQSRLEFLEKHWQLIKDLVEGKLLNRNRFRELLLGSKGLGKSSLLKILRSFTSQVYPKVIVVWIEFSVTSAHGLFSRALQEIKRKRPDLVEIFRESVDTTGENQMCENVEILHRFFQNIT